MKVSSGGQVSTLSFEVEWVPSESLDPRLARTAANLTIIVDGVPATRLLDSWSKTVVDDARLPLFPLAEWAVYNWWRIHAEPAFESGAQAPASWRLAHDLPGIGKGYVWPRLRLAGDGEAIVVSAKPARFSAAWEPVTHLAEIRPAAVAEEDFDRALSGLVDLVLDRLHVLKVGSEPLASLWREVSAERTDKEVTSWRTWEARLGYDPDEAPEVAVARMIEFADQVGQHAIEEVAPVTNGGDPGLVEALVQLSKAQGVWSTLPTEIDKKRKSGELPWDYGHRLGRVARKRLHLGGGPINDSALSDALGIPRTSFEGASDTIPLGLGVRHQNGKTALHFRRRNRPGRRFEAARFIADNLLASKADVWLPLTDRGTARQKIQRSFAAELLMPIDEIADEVGESRSPAAMEDVADRYGVSPLAVRSHLANYGLLPSDEVFV